MNWLLSWLKIDFTRRLQVGYYQAKANELYAYRVGKSPLSKEEMKAALMVWLYTDGWEE